MTQALRNPFIAGPPVHDRYFIGRQRVLDRLSDFAATRTGNILLYGDRRVGKTSVCLEFLRTCRQDAKRLAAYMSMESNYSRPAEAFTQSALLHIIAKAASSIFSKRYSDLLLDVSKPHRLAADYGRLLQLFALVRGADRKIAQSSKKEVSAFLVAKAGAEEIHADTVTYGSLTQEELIRLLDELVDFLNEENITSFVLVVDEANKFALETNAQIIRESLSAFSNRGLRFCFVTTPEVISQVSEATELFHDQISVGPFDQRSDLVELIERYYSISLDAEHLPFDDAALDAIWSVSHGVPYELQMLCSRSLTGALSRSATRVQIADVLAVVGTARS